MKTFIVSEELAEKLRETTGPLPHPLAGVPLLTSKFLKGNQYIELEALQKAIDKHMCDPTEIPWLDWKKGDRMVLIDGPFKGATGVLRSLDLEKGLGNVEFDKPEQRGGRMHIDWMNYPLEFLKKEAGSLYEHLPGIEDTGQHA